MDSFERDIKIIFLTEAREYTDQLEGLFLDLEKKNNDTAIVEHIFRIVHSLKGSSGAAGFDDIKVFFHTFESLLAKVKNQEIPVDKALINLFLKCNDHAVQSFTKLVDDLEARSENKDLVAQIETWILKAKKAA